MTQQEAMQYLTNHRTAARRHAVERAIEIVAKRVTEPEDQAVVARFALLCKRLDYGQVTK